MPSNPIEQYFLIGLTTVAVFFWAVAIKRLLAHRPLVEENVRPLLPWNPEEVLLGFAAFIVVPAFAAPLTRGLPDHLVIMVLSGVQMLTSVLVAAYLVVRHQCNPLKQKTLSLARQIWNGISTYFMWVPLVLGIQLILTQWIPYEHNTIETLQESTREQQLTIAMATFLSAAIFAPIAEETVFRWILQGWLRQLWFRFVDRGPKELEPSVDVEQTRPTCWVAIVASSLLFAALHAGQGPAPIPLFVLSLGIGYLFDRTGSLVSCIVVHMMLNAVTMALLIFGLYQG